MITRKDLFPPLTQRRAAALMEYANICLAYIRKERTKLFKPTEQLPYKKIINHIHPALSNTERLTCIFIQDSHLHVN